MHIGTSTVMVYILYKYEYIYMYTYWYQYRRGIHISLCCNLSHIKSTLRHIHLNNTSKHQRQALPPQLCLHSSASTALPPQLCLHSSASTALPPQHRSPMLKTSKIKASNGILGKKKTKNPGKKQKECD